ncbi:putative oxidoreductase YhhX [Phycisphaerae bacterium RAS1]|nr:putative oxidoreductase YhhX [Phycisphaerae bacterium RAS1]
MPTCARSPSVETGLYRAAVVGCGRIGCGFDDDSRRGYVASHAGALHRSPRFELAALCDVDFDRVRQYSEKLGVEGRYRDFRVLLDEESPDLLSVCTHADTHEQIVVTAADAGVRAILCEKPLAPTLDAADRMIRACQQRGALLFTGHQRRFDPAHRAAADALRTGALGSVQQVTCYYTAGIHNTGTHLLDLLRLLFGDALWVQGAYSHAAAPDPRDPNIDAIIAFEHAPRVVLSACDVRHYTVFEVDVLAAEGRLRIGSHGFDFEFEAAAPHPRFSGYRGLERTSAPFEVDSPREFLLATMDHIAACLDGQATPCSTGVDGRMALELILALKESADHGGRTISLP